MPANGFLWHTNRQCNAHATYCSTIVQRRKRVGQTDFFCTVDLVQWSITNYFGFFSFCNLLHTCPFSRAHNLFIHVHFSLVC